MVRLFAMAAAMGSECSLNNSNSNVQLTLKLPFWLLAVLRKVPLQL
jgi:hypothetical protein